MEIGSLGGTVFPGGTLYPSANYVIFILVYWYRRSNLALKKGKIYISLHWHFFFRVFPQFKTNEKLILKEENIPKVF